MTKKLDLARLTVQEFIAHRVPRRRKGDTSAEPELSEAIPPQSDRILQFFTRRLQRTLQQRGQAVEVDPKLKDPRLPEILRAYLAGEEDLVPMSRAAATHLFESQTGSHYEQQSLFVAAKLAVMGELGVAVMKLEEEEGVHFNAKTIDGKATLEVELLDDLTLTDNTRVFKSGAFWLDKGAVYGHVSDQQQGASTDVADYFLRTFLGCRHQRQPSLVTKDFYETIERFITTQITEDEQKLDAYDALQTELRSQRKTIDPPQFVADHIDPAYQDQLTQALSDAGVPQAEFRKDLARLGTRPSRSRLKTANGITISGAAEEISERVKSHELDGQRVIVIRDTLSEV